MANSAIIHARDFCQPGDSPVASAQRIAETVLQPLSCGHTVSIAMDGVAGASSSFFNVVFAHLAKSLAWTTIDERVRFTGLNRIQAEIERRSRSAVLRPAS